MMQEHSMECLKIDLRHMKAMTDSIGMLQFSYFSTPDPQSGYTIDDNARALLVALNMEDPARAAYSKIYFNFIINARRRRGGWHNLRLADGFVPDLDSQDSWGRTFLACCFVALSDLDEIKQAAWLMVQESLPYIKDITSPRAVAYALIGISSLLESGRASQKLDIVAAGFNKYLLNLYHLTRGSDWNWYENSLTYCNGIVPHALFAYYGSREHYQTLQAAQNILGFLSENLFRRGYLNVVGNRGWWCKGKPCPDYDQQPVDAGSFAMANGEAFRVTGQREYLEQAQLAGEWYWGKNINNMAMYDYHSGGCYDALVPGGVNLNQGAEATLSFLLTMQLMKKHDIDLHVPALLGVKPTG